MANALKKIIEEKNRDVEVTASTTRFERFVSRFKQSPKAALRLQFIFVLLLGSLVYSNSINNGFYFDDSHVIQNNPYVKELSLLPEIFVDGRTSSSLPENSSYRPITTLFYAACWQVAAGKTWPFHVLKIILHVGVAWLLYLIAMRLLKMHVSSTINAPTVSFAYWKNQYYKASPNNLLLMDC